MKALPIDIEKKIDLLFTDPSENLQAKKLICSLGVNPLNVGRDQLARSLLTISGPDLQKLKVLFEADFNGDPRDVIMEAEACLGNPGHYFIPTFDEMENGNSIVPKLS